MRTAPLRRWCCPRSSHSREAPACVAAEPVKLIFDTDIGNDVDDVLALGLIHALQSRGQCELLAVTITKDQPLAAEFVDADQHVLRPRRHSDRHGPLRGDSGRRQVSAVGPGP